MLSRMSRIAPRGVWILLLLLIAAAASTAYVAGGTARSPARGASTAIPAKNAIAPVPANPVVSLDGFCGSNPPPCPDVHGCANPGQCSPTTSCTSTDTGMVCCTDGVHILQCTHGETIHKNNCGCAGVNAPCYGTNQTIGCS